MKKLIRDKIKEISEDYIGNSTVATLKTGRMILINRQGHPISNSFDLIEPTEDGEHWCIEENGIAGVMNTKGEIIIYPGDYNIQTFYYSDGLLLVKKDELYGFVNEEGKLAIPFKYEEAKDFVDGFSIVRLKGKAGIIDNTDVPLGDIKYDEVYSFQENRAPVKLNEKWGFIDKEGKEIIPLVYDQIFKFHEGLAGVRKGAKWGFIKHDGNEAIPFTFDLVWDFKDGKAKVKKDNREYYIDKTGKEI